MSTPEPADSAGIRELAAASATSDSDSATSDVASSSTAVKPGSVRSRCSGVYEPQRGPQTNHRDEIAGKAGILRASTQKEYPIGQRQSHPQPVDLPATRYLRDYRQNRVPAAGTVGSGGSDAIRNR